MYLLIKQKSLQSERDCPDGRLLPLILPVVNSTSVSHIRYLKHTILFLSCQPGSGKYIGIPLPRSTPAAALCQIIPAQNSKKVNTERKKCGLITITNENSKYHAARRSTGCQSGISPSSTPKETAMDFPPNFRFQKGNA